MNLMERRRALMGVSKKIEMPLGLKDFKKGGHFGTLTYDSANDTLRRYGNASWQGAVLLFSTEMGYTYTVECDITVDKGNARVSVRAGTDGTGTVIKSSPSQTSGTEHVTFTFDHDSDITSVFIFVSWNANIDFDVSVSNFVFYKEKVA